MEAKKKKHLVIWKFKILKKIYRIRLKKFGAWGTLMILVMIVNMISWEFNTKNKSVLSAFL